MNTLKPVTRTTLSEQVALQIVNMLSAGKWRPGDRLPSEAELCKVLRVGRSTLREALKMLSFVGIVRMRAGEGTFVAQAYKKFLEGIFTPRLMEMEKTVLDLFETRLLLECELAAFCAERATDEDLRNLDDLVKEMHMHAQLSEERLLDLDMSFHTAIAVASQNQVLAHVYQEVRGLVTEFARKTQEFPGSHERMYAQHTEILSALKERNPSKARGLMRKHVRISKDTLELLIEVSKTKPIPQEDAIPVGQTP